jgi:hypothetical protein
MVWSGVLRACKEPSLTRFPCPSWGTIESIEGSSREGCSVSSIFIAVYTVTDVTYESKLSNISIFMLK